MAVAPLDIDTLFRCSKTVSESDIYLFAGISGDFAPQHVDEQYMQSTPFGGRIAHGGLILAYVSRLASTAAQAAAERTDETALSYGYDHVRFIRAVRIGDTIDALYRIIDVDSDARRTTAQIEVRNQRGEMVAVAQHLMKWVKSG